jgi:DNA-binding XRE family transcriptional regulator
MRNTGKNRIKEVMREQGRQNTWMCEKLEIKSSTFGHYLNNHTQPSIFQLKKVAQVLDVAMEDLVV